MLVKLSNDNPTTWRRPDYVKGVTASFLLHDVFAVRPGPRRTGTCGSGRHRPACWCNAAKISVRR